MTETVNLEEIKCKLIEKLTPSGWATKLRGFIQSSDFDKILEALYQQREAGKRFTPPLKDVFKAFEECPEKDLKVVIIGQDPYPSMNVADGIAFSCSRTGKPQPSLKFIFEEIERTVYQEWPTYQEPDLKRWSKQASYLMTYFHPRDFDPDQPMIDFLPIHRKFKSYVGLKKAFSKFQKLLNDFEFLSIDEADKKIDWKNIRTIDLSN